MRSSQVLAGAAARLNREAGRPPIPSLYFLTDPERTPDPVRITQTLPRGAAVIYRHFGAGDRRAVARCLAAACRARGLTLLIAADPALARACGAVGVHWPERLLPARPNAGFQLVTCAAHSPAGAARARAAGVDACLLSPVFRSRSPSAGAPLGLFRAGRIARGAGLPIIALGGVNPRNAQRLAGRGFAGIAAIDGMLEN
ncbi:MAG: thiamine phosphate synthase [Hyphomonadaceae bacterium]